jgi:RNA polymerase primary sigma factor/RNA polymerase sigma factor
MHTDYKNPALRQLRDQQVRFAPREKKIEQVNRAERLLCELQAEKTYSYEYLCFRITRFRPESHPEVKLSGRDAIHDVRLLVEDLSDAADVISTDADERVLTVDELSKCFQVSTKTISRWRRRGLVSRRFIFGGRKRVGFLHSSVERFVAKNEERVRRGARFSQLTDAERCGIVERARRLARAGGCLSEIARRLARHSGRSVETVRYTLSQFDRDHPDLAIFPDRSGPLQAETRRRIYQLYRCGQTVASLSRQFCRTKTSIYRIVNEMRAERIMDLSLDYIPNDSFAEIAANGGESEVLGPPPASEQPIRKGRLPAGLPPYLASLYEVPLLTREQEVHLFRKFNYLKHKADGLRRELDLVRPRAALMDQIDRLYDQSVQVKNEIISANLRLVVSIAKRHVAPNENFFDLVSDGNMSLIRAVEKFDFGRGNKFSTYASWAIMKNFARTIPDEHRHRDRYRTSHSDMFMATEDERSDQYEQESAQLQREFQVDRILGRLDDRERRIIISRFGLNRSHEPLTLKQVGAQEGVTKERIRQIEARTLNKLRKVAQEERLEIPGGEV